MKLMTPLTLLLLILLALSSPAVALDPGKKITQYVHEVWGVRQGLPQSTVEAITQTRDGYIWVGTEEGLARFDGMRFDIYDRRKVPQLRSNYITTLYEDQSGNLWIGTLGGGLTRMKDGKYTTYSTREGLAHDVVWAIHEDPLGRLWIGTEGGGLNRMKDGKFARYTTIDGLANDKVWVFHEDRSGILWIGTGGGLSSLDPTSSANPVTIHT
ncbi:MAG: hypothetical protein GY940_38805, partial [bacterium]|nr:hypothetical protein [bacterium]